MADWLWCQQDEWIALWDWFKEELYTYFVACNYWRRFSGEEEVHLLHPLYLFSIFNILLIIHQWSTSWRLSLNGLSRGIYRGKAIILKIDLRHDHIYWRVDESMVWKHRDDKASLGMRGKSNDNEKKIKKLPTVSILTNRKDHKMKCIDWNWDISSLEGREQGVQI